MGHSDPENKPWAISKIIEINPKTVLDCGAGAGIYLDLIKGYNNKIRVDGLEIWQPYIEEYSLPDRYDNLIVKDLRDQDNFKYDLVIFGDILEHMSEEEALRIWDSVSKQAKYALISIPIIHYHQGAINNNPYEVHVEEDWSTEKVLQKFKNIVEYKEFQITGTFIAKFEKAD